MKLEFWAKFRAFTIAMQKRFEDKEKEYGDTWDTLSDDKLIALLDEQLHTLRGCLQSVAYPQELLEKELIDTANRCLTVWARLTRVETRCPKCNSSNVQYEV